MLYPFTFQPIFKERVWGGRRLADLYRKSLPAGLIIGESWEIADRPEGVSVISNGPLAGRDLRWLMENHGEELLGESHSQNGRFPLLIKILDAQEKLSLQVHPPAGVAATLGGEPKTEMWYVAQAAPDADLFVGLRQGVTRAEFERKLADGSVAECFHRLPVRAGDAMFLPSGRVHAIGAGIVIFEIQQNSDSTYRVFDWNRVGLDGKPRDLQVRQSLACIDFDDCEPALSPETTGWRNGLLGRQLVNDPLFRVDVCKLSHCQEWTWSERRSAAVVGVVSGRLHLGAGFQQVQLEAGMFCLLPALLEEVPVRAEPEAQFLVAEAG